MNRMETFEFPQLTTQSEVAIMQNNILCLWDFVSKGDLELSQSMLRRILGQLRGKISPSHTINHAIYMSILENLFCFIATFIF